MGGRATSNDTPGEMFGEGPIAEARYLEDFAARYRATLVSEALPAA